MTKTTNHAIWSIGLLALAAAVAMGGKAALAAVEEPAGPQKAETALQTASGKIAAVDKQQKVLKVESGPTPMEFTVDDRTTITKGAEQLSLAELKKGDAVKVEYVQQAGKRIARLISVELGGSMKPGLAPGGAAR